MPKVQGQLTSYEIFGKVRDLSDVITMISPTDTPFQSAIGSGKAATQTTHEWTKDELAEPRENAHLEGEDVTEFEESNVIELQNKTQIFQKAVKISGTAEETDQAGVTSQVNRETGKKMKEAKKDFEYALLSNVIDDAGSKTTPRHMRGLPAWIVTNALLGSGGAPATQTSPAVPGTMRALTRNLIDEAMQRAYECGGNPSMIMTAPALRRVITEVLKITNQQQQEAASKKVTNTVTVYQSDFGDLRVVPNRVQAKVPYSMNAAFILDAEYWKKSFYKNRGWKDKPLGVTGDNIKRMIVAEATLEARAEESSAMIADLDPALTLT